MDSVQSKTFGFGLNLTLISAELRYRTFRCTFTGGGRNGQRMKVREGGLELELELVGREDMEDGRE